MDMIKLADEIINGRRLGRDDELGFFKDCDLDELCKGADKIRAALCGSSFDLCTIINGRSGRCSENCKFCAQSAHHSTGVREYGFMEPADLVADCMRNEAEGVHRYSIVTAGKTLTGSEFEKAIEAYKLMSEKSKLILCASHGLLTEEQFVKLKECGVTMYHENIETSRSYFPKVCTTHTYDDKINTIKLAKKAGLTICCGGIIGMGESWEDRVDMAVSIAELEVESIPLNALMPMKGTPMEDMQTISEEEILRTCAMFRYIVPTADIRLAAGRGLMADDGKRAFSSGVNAAVTGNMLTTGGSSIRSDREMLTEMGFSL